jgi:hypothetical protein
MMEKLTEMSKKGLRNILINALLLLAFSLNGQDKTIKDVMSLSGYVKNLTTVFIPPGNDTTIFADNLLHNRLDYVWFISDKFTFNTSMRNRFFYGETVKALPEFYDMLGDDLGFLDLSILWFNAKGMAFQTTFDRLNIDFQSNDWQVIVGRHRINWGVNLIWNPNDIFNAYSYFDFDYEEFIGTDAILTRRYINATSSAELVYAPANPFSQSRFAGMYKFLAKNYDVQVLAGYLNRQIVFGGGWAGDIKGAGFRGEMTVFIPDKEIAGETQFVGAVDVDYTFAMGLYVHASYLFNSLGIDSKTGDYTNFFLNNEISAQTLSPAMHNIFAEVGGLVSPIVRLTFASWFNPSDGSLFLGPSIDWSVAENLQVLFNVQGFIGKDKTLFGNYGSFYYLRFRYSF